MAVETLREAWQYGWEVRIVCASGKGDGMKKHRACAYSATLDMKTLLIAKGPAFPLTRLGHRLWCPMCHQTRMRVLFTPGVDAPAVALRHHF